tara:strand:- start:244 stop:1203 length:960 start_codon:yes stop_codon:yes gene_type:complete
LTKIAHIINPVKVNQISDLFMAQPITFQSMLNAKNNAANRTCVKLYTTQFEEDIEIIPEGFTILPNLKRSVLDVNATLENRKLPLIKDILASLFQASTADYFIYTNADIGLMPNFYTEVFNIIEANNCDAIIINRRRLKTIYTSTKELEHIYKDKGKSHPGFDCFVFKRSLLAKFILDEICVGIPFLGVSLAYNIFSFAENPIYIPDEHLTFHIGVDVLPERNNEFYKHNFNSFFHKIKPVLRNKFDLKKFPYANKHWITQFFKFGLNPSLSTRDFLEMKFLAVFKTKDNLPEARYTTKDGLFKFKRFLNELRWHLLEK